MESSAHQHGGDHGGRSGHATRGRLLDRGWRYDLEVWFADTFLLRGGVRALRRRVLELAGVRAGQAVLDVGCGTGTLAIEAAARIGRSGRVAGIDPAPRQIARARSKARRAGLSIDFQPGVIEAIPFADGSFGAVTSTLMMHHLPEDLRHQGLSEILRVLQPGGSQLVAEDLVRCPAAARPEAVRVGAATAGLAECCRDLGQRERRPCAATTARHDGLDGQRPRSVSGDPTRRPLRPRATGAIGPLGPHRANRPALAAVPTPGHGKNLLKHY